MRRAATVVDGVDEAAQLELYSVAAAAKLACNHQQTRGQDFYMDGEQHNNSNKLLQYW